MNRLIRILGAAALLSVALAGPGALAEIAIQCPADTDGVDTDGDGDPNNDVVCRHIGAGDGFINMGDGRLMYMFGFSNLDGVPVDMVMMHGMLGAEFPAPTIVVKEGQRLYLTLTNVGMFFRPDLFDPHSVHWHGFPNAAPIFDGVPDASLTVNMAASLTYFYDVVEPGTFLWHCHVEATEHMQMGMLGNLWVLPRQNNLPDGTNLNGFIHHTGYKYAYNDGDGSTYYDVESPVQIHAFDPDFHEASLNIQPLPFAAMSDRYPMLNGRGYPDTVNTAEIPNTYNGRMSQKVHTLVTARRGQKILLRMTSLATTRHFTLTASGLPMQVVGRGARLLRGPDGKNLYQRTSHITLGGGEAADVIVDTALVEPGVYCLYTSNLESLNNDEQEFGGMMTEIRIE